MNKNLIIGILITTTSICATFSVMIGVNYFVKNDFNPHQKVKEVTPLHITSKPPIITNKPIINPKIETYNIDSILEEQNLKREIIEKTIVNEQNKHLEILSELTKQFDNIKFNVSSINTQFDNVKSKISSISNDQRKIFEILNNFKKAQDRNIQRINNLETENANLLDKYNNLVIAHNSIHEQVEIIIHKIKNPPQQLKFIEPRKITPPESGTIQIEGDTYIPSN